MALPALIVVSGPPGTGKTTLAHAVARAVGCPAICRDEIKEGMAHATPGHVAGELDELALRTLPTFFGVVELLLDAGVTTVAEAAFQDRLWRPALEKLRAVAEIRVVACSVGFDVAWDRRLRRMADDPVRRAHEVEPPDPAAASLLHGGFAGISLDVPTLRVDTSDGYTPGLEAIADFARGRG